MIDLQISKDLAKGCIEIKIHAKELCFRSCSFRILVNNSESETVQSVEI